MRFHPHNQFNNTITLFKFTIFHSLDNYSLCIEVYDLHFESFIKQQFIRTKYLS